MAAVLRLGERTGRVGALSRSSRVRRPGCPPSGSGSGTSRSPIHAPAARSPTASNLTIPAGTSLAIVGQNGAGKTTLAKLLRRLYDPTAGAIEVDGVDLRDLDLASWRARVAAVFQDFV